MNAALWLAIGVIAFVVVVCALYLEAERHPKPVLPSHYDPQHYMVDPTTIPGWCPECETMNESGYRFCENCSAKLPTVDDGSSNRRRFAG